MEYRGFLGFEREGCVGSAIMGFEKGHWLIGELMDYYKNSHFILENGQLNMLPNTTVITDILKKHGMKTEMPFVMNDLIVEKPVVFYGQPDNSASYGVHYFRGSWWSEKERNRSKSFLYNRIIRPIFIAARKIVIGIFGNEKARKFENYIKNLRK